MVSGETWLGRSLLNRRNNKGPSMVLWGVRSPESTLHFCGGGGPPLVTPSRATVDAYDIAFEGIETHSPFLCPCTKCLQVTLQYPLVAFRRNNKGPSMVLCGVGSPESTLHFCGVYRPRPPTSDGCIKMSGLVLLRCHFSQGRSASVGVSLKKSVVGSVTVFISVYTCALNATVQLP